MGNIQKCVKETIKLFARSVKKMQVYLRLSPKKATDPLRRLALYNADLKLFVDDMNTNMK